MDHILNVPDMQAEKSRVSDMQTDKSNEYRKIDERAIRAAADESVLEEFIAEEMAFILACAGKACQHHIEENSDEALTALEAFVESVGSYSYEKGSFLSFAELVIRRRLIDEIRRSKKHAAVIPMDPADLVGEQDNMQTGDFRDAEDIRDRIKAEIESLGKTLNRYGFALFDLAEASPKAAKTKDACRSAVVFVIKTPMLLQALRSSGMLPIKIIEKNTGLPRKVLERHRKYIIAAVEILDGDYPCLSEYMSYIKRSCL